MFGFGRRRQLLQDVEYTLLFRFGLSDYDERALKAAVKVAPDLGKGTAAGAAMSYQMVHMAMIVQRYYDRGQMVPADLERDFIKQIRVSAELAREYNLSMPGLLDVLPYMTKAPSLSDGFRAEVRPILIEHGFRAADLDAPLEA